MDVIDGTLILYSGETKGRPGEAAASFQKEIGPPPQEFFQNQLVVKKLIYPNRKKLPNSSINFLNADVILPIFLGLVWPPLSPKRKVSSATDSILTVS